MMEIMYYIAEIKILKIVAEKLWLRDCLMKLAYPNW